MNKYNVKGDFSVRLQDANKANITSHTVSDVF